MATISSLTQNEAFKRVIKYFMIVVGSAIYAVGFQFFMYPNNIVSGGVTGISMIINHFTGFPGGVAGKLLHAGQRSTVPVVAPASILLDPAVLAVLLQGEGIREISDRAEEMGAVVAGQVFTVVVGIQTVLLLEILILRHRLKHMEVCIDVIRQITADRAGELAVFIPSRRIPPGKPVNSGMTSAQTGSPTRS